MSRTSASTGAIDPRPSTDLPGESSSDRSHARWPWAVFGLAALAAAVLVMYLGRHLLFFFDEWDWILRRREPSLDALLEPHFGHLSLIPVAFYELFLWLFGLTRYEAFRALVLALHLGVCTLAFVHLRRCVAPVVALAGAIMLLFFGSGWQDIIWPFQIGFLLSVGAGVGAFLLLRAETRRADIAVAICIAIALASSSVGIPLAAGIGLDLALRRRWSRLWVVAAPVVLYVVWYLTYGELQSRGHGLDEFARFEVEAAGAVVGSIFGVGNTVGQVLLLAVVPAFIVAVARTPGERRARLLGLAAVPVVFWTLLGISRAGFQPPDASRYLYPAAVFVVLLAAECVRGVRLPALVVGAIVVVAAWSVVWNVGELRDGRNVLLEASNGSRIDLGAIYAGVRQVPRWYDEVRDPVPEEMRLYAEAFDELGSPVATVEQLASGSEPDRLRADAFLSRAVGLRLSGPTMPIGRAPTVNRGNVTATDGPCITFGGAGQGADGEVEAASRALLIESIGGAPVRVQGRSFADGYTPDAAARHVVPSSTERTLVVPRVAGRSWKVAARSEGPVRVCAAGVEVRPAP